jgi:site-specific DNA recombinase
VQQQDRLLNMRRADDIDQETFARKSTELCVRVSAIKLQLDAVDRTHDETAELATKVFELSQTPRQKWLNADYDEKRRILDIVCLNCTLDDASLVPTIRKPFDVLAEGLISTNSRGDKTAIELFAIGVRAWPRALDSAAAPLMAESVA